MSDFRQALELIQETAVDAAELQNLSVDDPRREYFYDRKKGDVRTIDVPPAVRSHKLSSLDDFIAYTLRCKLPEVTNVGETPAERVSEPFAPVIWHDHGGIVLIINDLDRRDRVTMPLKTTPLYDTLKGLGSGTKKAQRELIDFLRLKIGQDNIAGGETLIGRLRKIKFALSEAGETTAQRGRESLDVDVKREVFGLEEVDEIFTVSLRVYDNPGEAEAVDDNDERASIACALDVDLENKVFIVAPLPGELDAAVAQAQAHIRARLAEKLEAIPIYYGQP